MYTDEFEIARARREWWQRRVEWKALRRANKRLVDNESGAPPYTTKDVPKLIQAQRERALRVIKVAKVKRDIRVKSSRPPQPAAPANGQAEGQQNDEVASEVPFVAADFEGISEDEDSKDPEEDGWCVWDWFTGPSVCAPRKWEPKPGEVFSDSDVPGSYFKVY